MFRISKRYGFSGMITAVMFLALLTPMHQAAAQSIHGSVVNEPYLLNTGLKSRSISFENPTGEPGKGGMAASPLGVGRKGAPAQMFHPGEEKLLADIDGPGTIRHIWMTLNSTPELLRGIVVRVWWEGQDHPSIEAPLGDFFGFAHGKSGAFQTAVHSVGESYGLNIWLPMPFAKHARVTISNESEQSTSLYYYIDYTIGDRHGSDVGRLHTVYRQENPTTQGQDFEILPRRSGKGRYLGTVIGVRTEQGDWWGEGEVKIYLDGDREFATIVGTGAEDYVGLSFGLQQTPFAYHGATLVTPTDGIAARGFPGEVSMYRWHLPDPVYWESDIRVTVQQIGFSRAQYYARPDAKSNAGEVKEFKEFTTGYKERSDNWSAATFWYEPVPSDPLPPMPGIKERLVD